MTMETADSNFHIRVRAEDKNLVDRAAEVVGANRSQFVLSAAVESPSTNQEAAARPIPTAADRDSTTECGVGHRFYE